METIETIVESWQGQSQILTPREWYSRLNGFIFSYLCNDMRLSRKNVNIEDIKSVYEDKTIYSFTGTVKTVLEMRNNEDLITGIITALVHEEPVSERLIKKINKYLMLNVLDDTKYRKYGERPGEYKKRQYTFCEGLTGSKPTEVQGQMAELVSFMASSTNDPIKVATIAHCMFEGIHPFSQGNGRTGRMVLNYYLLSKNYPPIIFFEEDAEEYNNAFKCYENDDRNPALMYMFLKNELYKTWATPLSISQSEVDFNDLMNKLSEE